MAKMPQTVILDDRLLTEELLVGLPEGAISRSAPLYTTAYWYYRACRAAVVGAGGKLSGPFDKVDSAAQSQAIRSLLTLRADIGLPDPRTTVPAMADLAGRHPRLNLLNLEAVAAASVLDAIVVMSEAAAHGVLPDVLDVEGLQWRIGIIPAVT